MWVCRSGVAGTVGAADVFSAVKGEVEMVGATHVLDSAGGDADRFVIAILLSAPRQHVGFPLLIVGGWFWGGSACVAGGLCSRDACLAAISTFGCVVGWSFVVLGWAWILLSAPRQSSGLFCSVLCGWR